MKILHTADIHLGVELYGHYDPRTGVSSRLQDFIDSFDRCVDRAIEEKVDLFLFAGDAYKTRDPSPTQQRAFAQKLRRLVEANIPVFLLTGNHDMPNAAGKATSLDVFGALALPNVTVAAKPDRFLIETASGPLQIIAVPWLTRSVLFSRDELKNATVNEMNDELLKRLDEFVRAAIVGCDPTIPTVLTLHGSVSGALIDEDRSAMLGHDLVIPKSIVGHPALSYVALGHIHKHQCVSSDPPIVYPGGLERIDFGEERDRKGFVLVDLVDKKASWTFVESGARPFVSLTVKAFGDDPTSEVLKAAASRDCDGAVVKITVSLLDANASSFQEAPIRTALKNASFVCIERSVDRTMRQRGHGFTTGATPLQNMRGYLEQQMVTPDRIAILEAYAGQLVADQSEQDQAREPDPAAAERVL